MQVKIQYTHLVGVINLLAQMPLKGLKSIHRTRFQNLLQERLKQVSEEELALIKEHAGTEMEGGKEVPKRKENGDFDIKDIPAFKKEQDEYFKQHYVIEGGDSFVTLQSVKKAIEEYEGELSGKEAVAYEHLYSAVEHLNGNKKDEGEDEHDGEA